MCDVNIKNHMLTLLLQIITAGYFALEDFGSDKGPSWEAEQRMYTTSSIAPVFVVQKLHAAGHLRTGSSSGTAAAKIVLISSEAGSITLRHEKEGGGNYAHHASKTALNMVGRLLSMDLKDEGVSAHPFEADAGDPESLGAALTDVQNVLGLPDVLVYNAVAFHPGMVTGLTGKALTDP